LCHCSEEKSAARDCPARRNAYCGRPKSPPEGAAMNHPEIIKLQKFLQQKFNNRNLDVRPRNKQNDSVEVYLGEEFLGLIYVDDEDGDRSYNFQMAILDVDLDEIH
jgi:hypothetical protein